jgi:predicted RNase H-like HicB family nuclease
MTPDECTYRTEWSCDDLEFVATVDEFPELAVTGPDPQQAVVELREIVAEKIENEEN